MFSSLFMFECSSLVGGSPLALDSFWLGCCREWSRGLHHHAIKQTLFFFLIIIIKANSYKNLLRTIFSNCNICYSNEYCCENQSWRPSTTARNTMHAKKMDFSSKMHNIHIKSFWLASWMILQFFKGMHILHSVSKIAKKSRHLPTCDTNYQAKLS